MLKALTNNKKHITVQGIENLFKSKLTKPRLTFLITRVLSKNNIPIIRIKVKRNLKLELISNLSSKKPSIKNKVQKNKKINIRLIFAKNNVFSKSMI